MIDGADALGSMEFEVAGFVEPEADGAADDDEVNGDNGGRGNSLRVRLGGFDIVQRFWGSEVAEETRAERWRGAGMRDREGDGGVFSYRCRQSQMKTVAEKR